MHIAHLARAENELLASALEDKLRFVLREHVRGAVVLLRQLLLPLHHFAGEANDHVVLIGLSVNRDGAECGPFDLHGLILVPISGRGSDSGSADELGQMPSVPAGHPRFPSITDPGWLHAISSSNPIILNRRREGSRPAKTSNDPMFMRRCS